MISPIISFVIIGLIVIYLMKKEKAKHDDYFGIQWKLTKKEKTILKFYKNIYKPIPSDKRFPNLKRDIF